MRRLLLLIAAAHLALGAAWAQKIVSTHFDGGPCGKFNVDGQEYTKTAVFLWPENSKHLIAIQPSYDITPGSLRCTVGTGWTDNVGAPADSGIVLAITASADKQWYKFTSSIECWTPVIVPVAQSMACNAGPDFGKVYVNGTCFDRSGGLWVDVNAAIKVQAYPPGGYVFSGWATFPMAGQSYQGGQQACLPVSPIFEPAAAVTFTTQPEGLQVLADRTTIRTPYTVTWAARSKHALSPVSPQIDTNGALWVWDTWGDGGDENHVYTMSDSTAPMTLTAKYAPGVRVGFSTVPAGLKLVVDGRDNWPNLNFVWKLGSKHTLAAPPEQTAGNGRKYAFRAWSAGSAEQEFIADGSRTGLIASFDALGQLKIQATPADVMIAVDGSPCLTPCVVDRRAGVSAKIAVPATVPEGDGRRLDFQGWADGGPRERSWTATTDAQVIVAGYQSSYRLTVAADPPDAGLVRCQPESPDGFYPAGSEIRLTVEPNSGYRFRGWAGDLSGGSKSAVVRAEAPISVRAMLEKIPYVPPAGVRNAVGDTPETSVAPGSIVTVFGGNLAPDYVKGPDSPLAQAISGVGVQVADRVLPLFFVSPEQINAQLPNDLAEGDYTLTVRGDNQADVTAKFTVQRNAPGLFTRTVDSRPFALASHADGSAVTLTSRARRGETITLLGTGLGPYDTPPPDGFAVPQDWTAKLADPVEIQAGDSVLPAVSAVPAPGYIGITAVKVKLEGNLPGDGVVELVVRVNGKESNKVLLPLDVVQ